VGLTGHQVAPKVYIALGIDGDTSQFMATMDAACIVAVQSDPEAPIVKVADYNIIGDPVEVARALLAELQ
jgi:electron transfer flavoprotein alpha subunit